MPDPFRLRADVGTVGLLEVASASAERRENGCGNVGFENRFGKPAARPHVYQVDGDGIRVVVATIRAVDAAQPEQPIRVAGPDERPSTMSANRAIRRANRSPNPASPNPTRHFARARSIAGCGSMSSRRDRIGARYT
ncbi:hypothetical protein AU188_15750 [Mycobacterium sp. IS-3022]|nr:hypothetical protein AU188_15750 [Mycobacterium sp. IS-3022]